MPIFGETRKLAGFSPGKNSQVDVNEAVYTWVEIYTSVEIPCN